MNEDFVKRAINKIQWDPNKIGLDIGAHHGAYSIPLARKCKHVYAFEPFPVNIERITEETKHIPNITVVQKAISNVTGKTKLYPCPTNTGGNSISDAIAECETWGHSLSNHIEVDTITIDDFVGDIPLGYIKMDIEGAEDFVWEGAVKTLKKNQLNIILEVHQKVNGDKLFAFFKKLKYTAIQDSGTIADTFVNDRHYLLYNGWSINLN